MCKVCVGLRKIREPHPLKLEKVVTTIYIQFIHSIFIYNITHKKYNKYTNNKMILKERSKGQKGLKRTPPIKQNQKEIRYKTHSNQTNHMQKMTSKSAIKATKKESQP